MNPQDQDKVLELAKEMLNSTKGEELHIFKAVDDHVGEIVAPLDYEKVCDYLELREKIAHERVDNYFDEKKTRELEGRRTYTRPGSETYHLIKECGGEASNYGKVYEKKRPCKLCREYTEDTINSNIQPKGIGFIPGKEEYHDDECLIWASHKEKVKKQICFTCEQERIYAEDVERQLREEDKAWLTGNSKSTGSGSQYKRTA